jgi:hypothetical protein
LQNIRVFFKNLDGQPNKVLKIKRIQLPQAAAVKAKYSYIKIAIMRGGLDAGKELFRFSEAVLCLLDKVGHHQL